MPKHPACGTAPALPARLDEAHDCLSLALDSLSAMPFDVLGHMNDARRLVADARTLIEEITA